ncbi:MAG TPA: cytochrome c [Anaerolineae bacterium]
MALRRAWFLLLILIVLPACSGAADASVPPTLSAEAMLGKQVFVRECAACHSTTPDTVIVGPSLAGIAARAETRVPGQDARVYLLNAVLNPGGHIVAGFEDLMPANFGKKLTGEEIDAVVTYLMTLE